MLSSGRIHFAVCCGTAASASHVARCNDLQGRGIMRAVCVCVCVCEV